MTATATTTVVKAQRCIFCSGFIVLPDPVCLCQVDESPMTGEPTYEEIAKRIGITRFEVAEIEKRVLAKLKVEALRGAMADEEKPAGVM